MSKYKEKSGKYSIIRITVPIIAVIIIAAAYLFYPDQKDGTQPIELTGVPTTPVETAFNRQGILSFNTPDGNLLTTIDIEIVDEEVDRQIGMMYRDEMAENQGMFFIFDEETSRAFWMKNTVIPLDIIFVNTTYEIVSIHKYAESLAEVQYFSNKPCRYVIEVNAGFTDKFKISEGDKIAWRRL